MPTAITVMVVATDFHRTSSENMNDITFTSLTQSSVYVNIRRIKIFPALLNDVEIYFHVC
jgi:hypothetical protein